MQLLKTVSAIFLYQQIIPLKTLRKMLFYLFHLKTLLFFSFSRYSNFYISLIPSFSPLQPLLEKMIEIPKVYDTINWLNKNLRTTKPTRPMLIPAL